jgi:hypothetical protein
VFVGTSPAVPGEILTTSLVDAFLPTVDVLASTDPVVRGLLRRGELAAEDLRDADGGPLGSGQLLADAGCRAIRADGSVHHRRFLLGPSVSGSAGSAGFARPGYNGPGFRQNDKVARHLLDLLTTGGVAEAAQPAAVGESGDHLGPESYPAPRARLPGSVHPEPQARPGSPTPIDSPTPIERSLSHAR